MELIDAHAHLTWSNLEPFWDSIISAALTADVKYIINVGVFQVDFTKAFTLQEKYPEIIRNIIGIHPEFSLTNSVDYDAFITSFEHNRTKFDAIGEIGLDFLAIKDSALRLQTEAIFRKMLDFAIVMQKPVVIHCRFAEKQAIRILKEYKDLSGVLLHCFSGAPKFIQEAIDQQWYFTIPTAIAFKKIFQDLAKTVPLDRILLESDAPFLAPSPELEFNEPKYVRGVAEEIARIKGYTIQEVAAITTSNTHRFFKF